MRPTTKANLPNSKSKPFQMMFFFIRISELRALNIFAIIVTIRMIMECGIHFSPLSIHFISEIIDVGMDYSCIRNAIFNIAKDAFRQMKIEIKPKNQNVAE